MSVFIGDDSEEVWVVVPINRLTHQVVHVVLPLLIVPGWRS